jgi:hypothetical protein
MTCLNSKHIQYIVAYNPSDPKLIIVEGSAALNARINETFDYWYFQVSCGNSFECFKAKDLIPNDIFNKILDRQVFLVVDNGLEPFLSTADSIYKNLIIKEGIPAEQIIFMSAVPTMIDHVKKLARELGQKEIKVEWFTLFEWSLKNYLNTTTALPKTLIDKRYDKKFINFNRRWRLHRPLIVTMLRDRGLLDLGYVSLGTSDLPMDTWDRRFAELKHYYHNNQQILQILDRNSDITNLPPMYLDTEDLVTNQAHQTTTTNKYYESTYFSVITETTYHTNPGYDGVPFLSEKVFKSIAMRHPFILVTAPNSLQFLKQLGYKTFEGLIDESYDAEINDGDRMIKIVNEIERLSKLSKKEIKDFISKAKPICDHNFQILKNKNSVIHQIN